MLCWRICEGQTLSLGKCLVGEKTDQIKIAVRNTSRKKREYVIQLDPSFTVSTLRPTFYFSVDETPPTIITQAQEKKLDEELEKLEHKLRIAVTKKKSDKIVKLNSKISRVKALLSGEQVPNELSASADSDLEAAGVSGGSSEVGEFDAYDSGNSESEYSESESSSRPRRRRSKPSDKPGVDAKSGLTSSGSSSQSPNMLHFSLEAEATGRIVAYAIFQPLKSDEIEEGENTTAFRSQKMKKRQLRRDSTPVVGVGKFLLFEQQNKDVVKELQYNAEVFTRTQAGESAFCRAVGRKLLPPSILPPHPKSIASHSGLGESSPDARGGKPQQSDTSMPSTAPYDDVLPSLPVPIETDSVVHHRRKLKIEIPDSGQSVRGVNVNVASDQFGISPVTSNLLVPAEESPADTRGWSVMLSLGSPSYKGAAIVEVGWCPVAAFRNVLALSCDVVPRDFLIPDENGANSEATETSDVRTPLPFQLLLPPDRTVSLHFKWCFASDAGFALSTSFASCVSRSILESISEAAELSAGKIEFVYRSRQSSPLEGTQEVAAPSQAISSLGVAVVKAVQRSLCFETDAVDLGEHQQGTDVRGEVIIHNRYHQALQFLLLAGSRDQIGMSTSSASPTLAGGDITFENATGTVEAGSHVTARFTYKGSVPGQHNEQIMLRNLSGDRLDTSVLTLAVRVTRPVYIRIPELDAHTTGQLEVLDLGPCYVTPEMQDTAADSPNVSLRFSKVHKLTLHSQVEETLVLCASSNLKTQCYVYEDVRLHHEATHVVLKGKQSTDLYVAIRPRLSGDAIKTGSTRDLVGGIRVQLFGFVAATFGTLESATGEEKSDMLAEFTIKFVGVAGASIARVTPSMIDFGVEHNSGRTQTCKTHEGRFELINMSKALPLGYRLFVTNTTEGYSDDDDSLHISLRHEKGEVPPGETGIIDFRLVAYTNGLFRRRIMVENIHYPGKISFVDVVLFVDSGALRCEVSNSTSADSLSHMQEVSARSDGTPDESSTVQTVHFGLVNVIKLEDELTDASSVSGGDGEPASRRYRIYEEHADGPYFEDQLDKDDVTSNSGLRAVEKTLVLTNTTDHILVVRPLSTLPLTFQWISAKREAAAAISSTMIADEKQNELMARSTSAGDARKLQTPVLDLTPRAQRTSVFYGDSYALAANSSCALSFRFASIAATMPLPVDIIENGKLSPLWGMIGIQSFEGEGEADSQEACTLKLVHISGYYGESRFQIADKRITLGKIGYAIGWKSSAFEVAVKNVSDVESFIVIANLPACIHVCNVRDATRVSFQEGSMDSSTNPHVPSLRMLALDVDKQLRDDDTQHWSAWKLPPRTTCMVEMELVRTTEVRTPALLLSIALHNGFSCLTTRLCSLALLLLPQILTPGAHEFSLRFFNLHNPHNHEDVSVRAQIISSYAELVVDPESSDYGMSKSEAKGKHVAFLPPVTVPTPQDAPPHRASFWFSLRNVYDEELCVKLSSQARSPLDRTIIIAPGDSVDIRVVCHVFAFARLPADTWSTGTSGATSEILDLGHVWLDVSVQNMENASQRKEVQVKGKLLPGKTFMLSASSLHFFAATTEMPADIPVDRLPQSFKSKAGISRESSQLTLTGASQQTSNLVVHQLRNSSESFWVRNPSTLQVLNFVVDPVSMYQPGLCLVEGPNESEMCAMVESIQAVAVPSSGVIAPGESVKIAVHLEEVPAVIPPSKTHFREGSSNSPTGKMASLHKMRHHPTWRSNSWDADGLDSAAEASGQNHMFLTVRDADASLDAGVSTEVDVHLVLQQQSSGGENAKQGGPILDKTLISAAFEAREKRLTQSRKLYPGPTLETHMEDEVFEQSESAALDNFEEFDISSIRSGAAERTNQLPVLTIRGCTPVEYSSLENTRYVIDVGQHTVRNGGEVEWEITIESLYSAASAADPGLDSVEYRLMLVDKNARSWLQLSRDRGTLDRARSYQSVVLYFLRDVVGVYSSFMVLQNMTNPSDLKVIHVRLEVIADLNSLRGMSTGLDPATNLFRVLVSSHSNPKRPRRSSVEAPSGIAPGGNQGLMIDYNEVFYHKLYQNHSIVIENSSGLSLDFILSTNARPQEVSFSVSPMSFNEVSTVTLGAHASMQVFLHFRPQPKQSLLSSAGVGGSAVTANQASDPWVREVEVYVSCRLVKDFRETVILRAICSQPQLMVSLANSAGDEPLSQRDMYLTGQPTFLGLVFPMLESTLSTPDLSAKAAEESEKYLVVHNTKSDVNARLALRNDSMFFSLEIDESLVQPGTVEVDLLENGVCAGRRSTLLVTIQPLSAAIFRVKPDVAALWKHHQLWDHSVKEHVTLYNIKQFAEHYQVTLCFTCRYDGYEEHARMLGFILLWGDGDTNYPTDLLCFVLMLSSNVASFYIPPNITESYPFSALEDIVAKFLQNYEYTWKWLITYHQESLATQFSVDNSSFQPSGSPAPKLAEILSDLENALDLASPLSPRNLTHTAVQDFNEAGDGIHETRSRDDLYQLLQSYRALYFDFYYITDELVWYGVRGNAVRHSLALADLAYGVVFNHEVFQTFRGDSRSGDAALDAVAFPRLLLPWVRQLGHFLSFFPENQEATQPLRQVYEQLRKFEL
ncbi:hypothetical protein BBJ28_00016271 [Nothophytophthora sp. Chile5]|nr:hypothetical protein BBJ28_00016271 [Nothophytophthora sp. Chile5]